MYTREDLSSVPSFKLDKAVPSLDNINITPDMVAEKLLNLNPSKSPGPTGWPLLALKRSAHHISLPLSLIFNKSLQSRVLPCNWKQVHVTPVHKKGSCTDPANYRPISLTSIVKLLESIIRDNITNHIFSNQLFADHQHGFVSGKLCTIQLLIIGLDYLIVAIQLI